jgi:integrase
VIGIAVARPRGRAGLLEKLMGGVRPEFRVDLLTPAADDPVLGWKTCLAEGCGRPNRNGGMCDPHYARWRSQGKPDRAVFLSDPGPAVRGKAGYLEVAFIDFSELSPQAKLELQYAVQSRWDEQATVLSVELVRRVVRLVAGADAASLLDLSRAEWVSTAEPARLNARRLAEATTFLIYARDLIEVLDVGDGWEVEYPRDEWRVSRLPGVTINPSRPRARSYLRFAGISQPWLKELAKRWARFRVASGLAIGTATHDIRALTLFSEFLRTVTPDVGTLADIDRELLERYLAWVSGLPGAATTRQERVGKLQVFFQDIRRHRWDETLPATAVFYTGDVPRQRPRLPRYLAEHVMAQVEQPVNLDRWSSPEGRLLTLILIRCGLRACDGCTLPFDCLLHDGQGAPYLRYYNQKMKREAAVPIDEELQLEIRAQQARVLECWPAGNPNLFPRPRANANGRRPLTPGSYRRMLNRWLADCDVRDEHGRRAHLTPHQWRHTFATRLINRDVPQEVIRVLLDHDSTEMTAHYARITDQTVRRRWEQATKVNIKGEHVTLDVEGPLAQAQWAKTRYGIATQTLPNGYCGLPVQKSCPHANACLTCPVFITGPEFLPELREQQRRTLTLIKVSTGKGHTRVTEMNQQVLTNLDRMISEVEKAEPQDAIDAS